MSEPTRTATPVADYVRTAQDHLASVQVSLVVWHERIGAAPNGAGHRAVEDIDDAIRALHEARRMLVGELRRYNDETMERSGRLLEQVRAEREARS